MQIVTFVAPSINSVATVKDQRSDMFILILSTNLLIKYFSLTVPVARSPESSFRQVGISANLFMAQRNNSLGLIERGKSSIYWSACPLTFTS